MNEVNPASLVPMVAWGGFLLAFVFAPKHGVLAARRQAAEALKEGAA